MSLQNNQFIIQAFHKSMKYPSAFLTESFDVI